MKRYPMPEVAEALRFLTSKGWTLKAVHRAAKEAGLSAVELANQLKGASR